MKSFERVAAKLQSSLSDDAPRPAAEAEDAKPLTEVQRILKAWEDKNYFSLMGLPEPEADELGRPVWSGGAADVSRAYRRLSVAVHPDKHPGDGNARAAFEALNAAHRLLKDPTSRDDVLRSVADRLRRRREAQEAAADLGTRVALHAAKNERARELRKAEGQGLQAHILEQVRRKQQEAARRAQAAARGQRKGSDEEPDSEEEGGGAVGGACKGKRGREGEDGDRGRGEPLQGRGGAGANARVGGAERAATIRHDSSDDDEAAAAAARNRRRKKPTFM